MKFGVREICDVVLKAKATQKVGNKTFYKHEPVIYFDTLKTSTLEGAATTVYAQGGAGNPRLVAWEGERTITFTMEDALISPEGFMILSGAGLIEAGELDANDKPVTIKQHMVETVDAQYVTGDATEGFEIPVSKAPYLPDDHDRKNGDLIFVMLMKDGEIVSEPYVALSADAKGKKITVKADTTKKYALTAKDGDNVNDIADEGFDAVMVDYYTEVATGAKQIEITADKFGGNYYLEASTLFRTTNGVDMPAEFIPSSSLSSLSKDLFSMSHMTLLMSSISLQMDRRSAATPHCSRKSMMSQALATWSSSVFFKRYC